MRKRALLGGATRVGNFDEPQWGNSGLWRKFGDALGFSGVEEDDAFAEQVEVGAAEHLSFDHLYAVHRPFDRSRAVGQGESIGDGVEIAAQPGDE
jgi:hypothetical protein